MMNVPLKMMNVPLKMMSFVSKMMNYVIKIPDLADPLTSLQHWEIEILPSLPGAFLTKNDDFITFYRTYMIK